MYIFINLIVSSIAVFGSLYLSEGLGLVPCKLCWFQRILMYPLPILILVAIIFKDRKVNIYLIILSTIGGVIALYHVVIQKLHISQGFCSFGATDCSTVLIKIGGVFTIPMLSLFAFVLIIVFSLLDPKKETN
ncbi:disulfide bond formation protein B [Rossellomorea aquimaris]|uniref:disulfide bond formation protein B n=1 Tax=Rossellomorea aquimaris TaxID=189382 RepID=UPI001CD7336C|nr:disulfide bond formation protein B [Rossellomorea aquimaris]